MKTLEQIKDEHAKELGFTDFEEMFSEALHTGVAYCVDAIAIKYAKEKISTTNGIELMSKERNEQIEKHGYSLEQDFNYYGHQNANHSDLRKAADILIKPNISDFAKQKRPCGWDRVIWFKMVNKPYKERLIIAGALIAAELDRMNHE